jgi:hypothetical protein
MFISAVWSGEIRSTSEFLIEGFSKKKLTLRTISNLLHEDHTSSTKKTSKEAKTQRRVDANNPPKEGSEA